MGHSYDATIVEAHNVADVINQDEQMDTRMTSLVQSFEAYDRRSLQDKEFHKEDEEEDEDWQDQAYGTFSKRRPVFD